MEKETRICPHCGGEILAVAKKCKHCKQWVEEKPEGELQQDLESQDEIDDYIDYELILKVVCGLAVIIFLGYYFTSKSSKEPVTEQDFSIVDTVEVNDTYYNSQPTVEEVASFTSPDLNTLFLQGHVRTVVEYRQDYDEFKDIYVFDTSGELVEYHNKYTDDEEGNKIVRRNGRIVSLGKQAYDLVSVTEFGYDSEGRCISSNCHTGHGSDEFGYTSFNENGFPSTAHLSGCYNHQGDEQNWSGYATFSYPNIDENGNWTICEKIIKKDIATTVYDDDGNEYYENETTNLTVVIIREITYY